MVDKIWLLFLILCAHMQEVIVIIIIQNFIAVCHTQFGHRSGHKKFWGALGPRQI